MEEAFRFYTIQSAYASYDEDKIGSIEPGKLADMVIFSENPLTIIPGNIRKMKVLTAIIGGKNIIYRKEN